MVDCFPSFLLSFYHSPSTQCKPSVPVCCTRIHPHPHHTLPINLLAPFIIINTHPLRSTNIRLVVLTRTPAFFCGISITHSCYLYRLNPLIDSSSPTLQHPVLHLEKGTCPMNQQRTVQKHSTAQHSLFFSLFFPFLGFSPRRRTPRPPLRTDQFIDPRWHSFPWPWSEIQIFLILIPV